MLTTDLVRVQVEDGRIRPRYVDPDATRALNRAEPLIALVRDHVGATQGELDEALADHLSEGVDLKLRQGLAKLLQDRCEVAPESDLPPEELRQEVFIEAGARHPVGAGIADDDRRAVLDAVAAARGITVEQVEAGLFADLRESHRIVAFEDVSARELLRRYNVALAQAVLLRASEVRISIRDNPPLRYRQLFRWVKFFQLSFQARPTPGGGYTITLDGPLSLFRQVQRYGFSLARFLPALLLAANWRLEADVRWERTRGRVKFELDPSAGLVSHYRDTGTWTPEEERQFADRFADRKTPWTLHQEDRIVSLGGEDVLVPDYVLRHEDGREALLEIVWSWRKAGLRRHLKHVSGTGPRNLVLAVSDRLQLDDAEVGKLPAGVVRFKQVLIPKRIEEAAERVAVHP